MKTYAFGIAEQEFILMMSKLTSKWGLGEAVGRIFASLLLHGGYLTQEELRKLTGYSTGLISSSLALLESMGLVTYRKRGRRKMYKAAGSLLDVVEHFLREIIERQLSPTISYLKENLSNFREEGRKNIEKLLREYEKTKLLLELNIDYLKKWKKIK